MTMKDVGLMSSAVNKMKKLSSAKMSKKESMATSAGMSSKKLFESSKTSEQHDDLLEDTESMQENSVAEFLRK